MYVRADCLLQVRVTQRESDVVATEPRLITNEQCTDGNVVVAKLLAEKLHVSRHGGVARGARVVLHGGLFELSAPAYFYLNERTVDSRRVDPDGTVVGLYSKDVVRRETRRYNTAMDALIAEAIHSGCEAFPGRSSARFIMVNGRRLRLQDDDGKLTEAGSTFWRQKGLDPPELYAFDRPVVNGHVIGHDGRPVKVHHTRMGKVTSKGLAYYRFHQCNITLGVPCLPVIDGEVVDSAKLYLPFSVTVPFVKYIGPSTFLASETDLQIMAERAVREGLPQGQLIVRGRGELPGDGDTMYIWDQTRSMRLEGRSTLPFAPPTIEEILNRALS